jgi:hypothetical protein
MTELKDKPNPNCEETAASSESTDSTPFEVRENWDLERVPRTVSWGCCRDGRRHRNGDPELMDSEERAAFEALPDEFVIYRGCGPHNVRGFSWSLSRDVAAKFPFYGRYHTEVPMLPTAPIPKSWAAAIETRPQGARDHRVRLPRQPVTPLDRRILGGGQTCRSVGRRWRRG